MLQLHPMVHTDAAIAAQIHSVQMAAYAQEAALLGVTNFPPLERMVDDICQSSESFLGAFEGQTLVGAMSTKPDEADGSIHIRSTSGAASADVFCRLPSNDTRHQP
jgi:hypothetical protein